MLNLHGVIISSITKTRVGSGVVELDHPYQGLRYAVINHDTRGRDTLKRESDGSLIIGTRVIVEGAIIHEDALLVIKVGNQI